MARPRCGCTGRASRERSRCLGCQCPLDLHLVSLWRKRYLNFACDPPQASAQAALGSMHEVRLSCILCWGLLMACYRLGVFGAALQVQATASAGSGAASNRQPPPPQSLLPRRRQCTRSPLRPSLWRLSPRRFLRQTLRPMPRMSPASRPTVCGHLGRRPCRRCLCRVRQSRAMPYRQMPVSRRPQGVSVG